MNLNCATVLTILLVVKCSGQYKETVFPKDSQPGYKVLNTLERNVTLTCDEGTPTSQLTIQKDDGRVLNHTTGHILSYNIDRVKCEHSGTYICVVSTSNLNYSRTINVAVVGCPPRLCQNEESNTTLDVVLYTKVSFNICVLVSFPKTKLPIMIWCKDQWFSNQTFGTHGICVSWYQDKSSIFLFTINITMLNVTEEVGSEINLKIGTNYNYMNNHINYTRQIQLEVQQNKSLDDKSTSLKTESTTASNTSDGVTTSTEGKRNNIEAIHLLYYFLLFVFFVMIIIIFVFLSRSTKVSYFGERLRLTLMLMARRLLEMCTSSQEKESGTTEPTAEFNGTETNTAETNTTETTLERIDATDYYISEEGLVYLELGQTAPRPITRSRTIAEGSLNLTYEDSVEYVALDFAETRDFEQYDDKEPLYTNQREAGVLRQL